MTFTGKVHHMLQVQRIIAGLFLLVIVFTYPATSQQTPSRINAGTLTCDIAAGVALIVDSPKNLRCIFHRSDGSNQAYGGKIGGGGLNVGVTGRAVAAWTVMTDTVLAIPDDLSGRYSGVQAGVAVGVGGTGSTLLSATNKAVSLQPLSVESRTGLNIALGVTQMELNLLGVPRPPAIAGPAPVVPDQSYARQEPPLAAPDYACGSETRLQLTQTLSGLARACRVSLGALLDANQQITNVRTISVGAVIRIPPRARARKSGLCDKRTIVNSGETAAGIASRCGVSMTALSLANAGIEDGRGVVPGQVLDIPDPREARNDTQTAAAPSLDSASETDSVSEEQKVSEDERPAPELTQERRAEVPDVTEEPAEQTVTGSLPGVGEDNRGETEQAEQQDASVAMASLRSRCLEVASNQLGLLVYQITAEDVMRIDEETYSVALNAGSLKASCVINRQGQVVSLQETEKAPDQSLAKSSNYDVITSRLPDDETLVMISMSTTDETRKTGRIEGYRSTAYGFQANANETLIVSLESDNTDCYFNVVNAEMPYGEALFAGLDEESRRATVRFPSKGIYLIRPFLREAAAQRKEIANYTLLVSPVGPVAPPSPDEADKIELVPSGKDDRLIQAY